MRKLAAPTLEDPGIPRLDTGVGATHGGVQPPARRAAGTILLRAFFCNVALALVACASQKATHAEERVSATLSEEEHAEAEAAASSSETRTQEPTRVTTTTEFFQPFVDGRPRGPPQAEATQEAAGGMHVQVVEAPAPGQLPPDQRAAPLAAGILIRRTVRIEERGKLVVEKQAEASGRASEALSIDAGVAVVSVADSSAKSAPAASCAFAGGLAGPLIVLAAVLGMAVYRRMTRS